jgi:hypothetical protein
MRQLGTIVTSDTSSPPLSTVLSAPSTDEKVRVVAAEQSQCRMSLQQWVGQLGELGGTWWPSEMESGAPRTSGTDTENNRFEMSSTHTAIVN